MRNINAQFCLIIIAIRSFFVVIIILMGLLFATKNLSLSPAFKVHINIERPLFVLRNPIYSLENEMETPSAWYRRQNFVSLR